MIMRLEEVTTCTHQSLNTIWERECFNIQEQSVSMRYLLVLKSINFKSLITMHFY